MQDSNSLNASGRNSIKSLQDGSRFDTFLSKQTSVFFDTVLGQPRAAWHGVALGILLVSVPVFFEAPLVRTLPWLAVALTGIWAWGSVHLMRSPQTRFVGDLLLGLSWSWLAGAIYWGWFRWEPFWHIPIESVGLPFALWGIWRGWCKVGHYFYLGSLLGTAATDLYFYRMRLMPYWRQLMQAAPEQSLAIIRAGFQQVQTQEGLMAAAAFTTILLALAWWGWRHSEVHYWVVGGTLIGTVLVDGLFVVLASV